MKKKRSREFKKRNEAVDTEEARRLRRERREARQNGEREEARKKPKYEGSRRQKEQRRKRALLYLTALLVLAGIFVFATWNVLHMRSQLEEVKQENERLETQKSRLTEELGNVESPEYVEQEARARLRMTKPGEVLYILPGGESEEAEPSEDVGAEPYNGEAAEGEAAEENGNDAAD